MSRIEKQIDRKNNCYKFIERFDDSERTVVSTEEIERIINKINEEMSDPSRGVVYGMLSELQAARPDRDSLGFFKLGVLVGAGFRSPTLTLPSGKTCDFTPAGEPVE